MSWQHYLSDPALREYFLSLPGRTQAAAAALKMELDLGELQLWAEHYNNSQA